MNNQHEDAFDIFLRKQVQQVQPYIDDGTFTQQVMAQLPAQNPLKKWQELLILLAPCFIIAGLVLSQFTVISTLVRAWVWLTLITPASWLIIAVIIFAATLVMASLWWAREERIV